VVRRRRNAPLPAAGLAAVVVARRRRPSPASVVGVPISPARRRAWPPVATAWVPVRRRAMPASCGGASCALRSRGDLRPGSKGPFVVAGARRRCGGAFPLAILFRGSAGGGAASGAGRKTIRTLPRCCTGKASISAQMRTNNASRSARSSLNTRILTNSCAVSAASISCSTAGVSPSRPMLTTGWRPCALARWARRCAGVSFSIGVV
jgi:hypothetical protein